MIHGTGTHKGVTLKAVVYGGSGEIKNPRFDLTPKSGQHFAGVKLGLRNFGTKPYTGDPSLTASVASDDGEISKALDVGEARLQGSHPEAEQIRARETLLRGRGQQPSCARSRSGLSGRRARRCSSRSRTGRAGTQPSRQSRFPPVGLGRFCAAPSRAPLSRRSSTAAPARYPIDKVPAKPHAGNHFIAVKVGLRNLGKRLYSLDPAVSAAIKNDKGDLSRAVKGTGLGQIELQKDETAYGRLFFELPDNTSLSSFRFRPFGAKGKLAVLQVTHGQQQGTSPTAKPLPDGGTRRLVQQGGTTLKAVVYGSSGDIKPDQVIRKARPGHHIVAIKFGLRNMQGGLYRANPSLNATITNEKGQVSAARPAPGRGIGKLALKEGQGIYGRIFFEIEDHTTPSTFRFRPFGAAGKPLVFKITHGGKPTDRKEAAHRDQARHGRPPSGRRGPEDRLARRHNGEGGHVRRRRGARGLEVRRQAAEGIPPHGDQARAPKHGAGHLHGHAVPRHLDHQHEGPGLEGPPLAVRARQGRSEARPRCLTAGSSSRSPTTPSRPRCASGSSVTGRARRRPSTRSSTATSRARRSSFAAPSAEPRRRGSHAAVPCYSARPWPLPLDRTTGPDPAIAAGMSAACVRPHPGTGGGTMSSAISKNYSRLRGVGNFQRGPRRPGTPSSGSGPIRASGRRSATTPRSDFMCAISPPTLGT